MTIGGVVMVNVQLRVTGEFENCGLENLDRSVSQAVDFGRGELTRPSQKACRAWTGNDELASRWVEAFLSAWVMC